MLNLLDTCAYYEYKFPRPQYLGAKHLLSRWIARYIPKKTQTILDAFSGSQSLSFLFKQMGLRVFSNDFLLFNYHIARALIENKDQRLTSSDIKILFSQNTDQMEYSLFEQLYADLFFSLEEARFIDSFRSNIHYLSNEYKASLAFAVMCRSLTRKVTMGHFAHTRAMVYANTPARIKRNRSLVVPLKQIFLELVPSYNSAIFNNSQNNCALCHNALNIFDTLPEIDVAYFDPPYCGSHADYQSFYHLLETFVRYWKDKKFINSIKRYDPQIYSGFDKKSEIIANFKLLFRRASNIPLWIISYNDRSYPDIDSLLNLIPSDRIVTVESMPYSSSRGGKGSVAGSAEILILCTAKRG